MSWLYIELTPFYIELALYFYVAKRETAKYCLDLHFVITATWLHSTQNMTTHEFFGIKADYLRCSEEHLGPMALFDSPVRREAGGLEMSVCDPSTFTFEKAYGVCVCAQSH